MRKVVFYSTHCPKCNVLQTKLNQKHIAYSECNDVGKMLDLGFSTAPVLEVDGVFMEFGDAVKWVNQQGS